MCQQALYCWNPSPATACLTLADHVDLVCLQARFLLAKLNPSATHQSDQGLTSEIIFTEDVSLNVRPVFAMFVLSSDQAKVSVSVYITLLQYCALVYLEVDNDLQAEQM